MSNVIKTIIDPMGFFHKGGLIKGSVFDGFSGGKDAGGASGAAPETPSANIGDVPESDAQKIARQRMFRSGTVYTSTLGEDITSDQLAGARLR
jgi:hypothetical protein